MTLVKIIASAFIFHKAPTAYIFSRNIVSNRNAISKSFLYCQRRTYAMVGRPPSKHQVNAESKSATDEDSNAVSSIHESSENVAFDGIPSLEQLRTDPFMTQVSHAEFVIGLIAKDAGRKSDFLMKRLRAQLSHPDGIRGFMVNFLTSMTTGDPNSENDRIPNSLVAVLLEQIDPTDDGNKLISLMCMNVVMPTAMKTQHTSKELSQQSASTANRAIRLLRHVLHECKSVPDQLSYKAILNECHAILSVAKATDWNQDDSFTDVKQAIWHGFFTKWGYNSQQRSDIARAMQSVLKE